MPSGSGQSTVSNQLTIYPADRRSRTGGPPYGSSHPVPVVADTFTGSSQLTSSPGSAHSQRVQDRGRPRVAATKATEAGPRRVK
ncbi:unnamed protein product [Pieris macdunnoughi]|uniref:Uncharacterized protein n=1 Tax=Pieris macdunnoughi TaxID=345717 RepID=A0A821U4T3_9NEOP|nr:unnamed protein product [Pieris macdunnoughi]